MDWTLFALRVSLATIAGLIIGLEREIQGKEAGLKTNALVSLGASIFILMSLEFEGDKYVDITRVLGQVVVGIGFIGAGTILEKKRKVKGLTTAATIWCSAGTGCLAGFGMYHELGIVCGIILIINLVFGYIEHKMKKKAKDGEEESN
ncbi:putative Mg2+ transporter-C (MgtC) family protein [Christiangramia gaetbulicola]|uniref:Putative Mg2+ transporter-C (MgtC) family protein n=1 Tax=Christiangramia gaetbulicola TaxID=703340 RepID=A0A2T6ALQ3_9FLAO|nr:MgtC/SapB family protein [Christiangramia gaetbulicola]PTX44735.1 putative Mg2+ transporter-C (MgtC) family protein [Christiangramia gaetbulicola]